LTKLNEPLQQVCEAGVSSISTLCLNKVTLIRPRVYPWGRLLVPLLVPLWVFSLKKVRSGSFGGTFKGIELKKYDGDL